MVFLEFLKTYLLLQTQSVYFSASSRLHDFAYDRIGVFNVLHVSIFMFLKNAQCYTSKGIPVVLVTDVACEKLIQVTLLPSFSNNDVVVNRWCI